MHGRPRIRRQLALVVVTLLAGRPTHAQVGQLPPRDRPNGPPPQAATGTGVVKGRVFDAQTGNALARARVTLNWMGRGGGRPPVTTDDSGTFVFADLPAGSFLLAVDKATYVTSRYPEAGQTMRANSRQIPLADGQVIDNLLVPMYHGGAIAGRIFDAHGDPVEFAQVQALRLPRSGRGAPQPRGAGSSNDLGDFRIPRLESGNYLLLVMPQRREMLGGMRGMPNAPDAVEAEPVPTFFPGVAAIGQAHPVRVQRGVTTQNVDVTLVEGAVAHVEGTLVDSSGQPVGRGYVSVRPIIKETLQFGGFGSTGASTTPDGTFRLRLPPGEYELEGRAMSTMRGPAPGDEQSLTRLTVAGDVQGLLVQMGPGARVSGRIVFDGMSPPPAVGPGNGPGSIVFTSASGGESCRSGRSEVAADGTFKVEGVLGTCAARVNGGIGRWFAKSITYDGKDLMDQPMPFTIGQQLRDVEVLMTDKQTELTLHVTDDHGAATRDYVALLFPTNQARWTDNSGRFIRTLVPTPDFPGSASGASAASFGGNSSMAAGVVAGGATGGTIGGSAYAPAIPNVMASRREVIGGVPPGEYYVIAVDDLEVEGYRDPEFLEQLARGATRVTIVEGVPLEVNLRRSKIEPPR